jgi:hypothetical protein
MALFDRIKGLLLEPGTEWPKIAAEPATAQSIYTGWVMILAAIPALGAIAGMGSVRFAVGQYVIALVITALLALIVDQLSPSFGGSRDFVASLKLVAYSYMPAWLAGVFLALGHSGRVLVILALLYAWYLVFLGAPVLKRCSIQRALPFTIVIVLCGLALGLLLEFALAGGGFAMRMGMSR